VEAGSILAGRYRVGRTIGRGGMGIVLEATHLQLGTSVAIKMLRKDALEEPDLIERFLREARSAAQLRGEHVCRVTDFGTTDDGIPFMVMELLEGEDLKTILDRSGPLDVNLTVTFVLEACIAVAEAHALDIVHRDLKPGNLFLIRRPDGRRSVKLVDFGIAKSTTQIDPSLTATTKAMGSPAYMSPEQLRSAAQVDPRGDVWSLGVTMYELLTEQRPFEGDTPYELALTISNEPPAKLPDTVPPEVAKIIMRCLEKQRDRRYASVADLAAALAPFSKSGKELAAEVKAALIPPAAAPLAEGDFALVPASPATETTLGGASGAVGPTMNIRGRSRLAIPLLALAGAVVLGVGGYVWWSQGSDAPPPAARIPSPPIPSAPEPVAPPPPAPPASPTEIPAIEPDAAIADEPPDAAAADTPPTTDATRKRKRSKPRPGKRPTWIDSRY